MDRRHFLQTAAVATATASLGSASSADAKSVHFDALAVVREMILAWRRQDLDAMLTHVADDIVWHTHVGSPPVVGKQAMHDFAAKLGASMHDIKWRIFTCETSPNGLWTARSSGTYLTTGSSSDSSPRSRSCMIAIPVNVLVMEAQ